MLRAIRPCRSITYVVGSPASPYRPASLPCGSRTFGKRQPNSRTNASASCFASWKSTPTNRARPRSSRSKRASSGASFRQGTHQEAQKLMTTGFPRMSARRTGGGTSQCPSSSGADRRSAAGAEPLASTSAPGAASRRPAATAPAASALPPLPWPRIPRHISSIIVPITIGHARTASRISTSISPSPLGDRPPCGAPVFGLVERLVEADHVSDARRARRPGDRAGPMLERQHLIPGPAAVGREQDARAGRDDPLRLLRVDREAHQARLERHLPRLTAVSGREQALLHVAGEDATVGCDRECHHAGAHLARDQLEALAAVLRAVRTLTGERRPQRALVARVDGEAVDVEVRQPVRADVLPRPATVGRLGEHVVARRPGDAALGPAEVHRVLAGKRGAPPSATAVARLVEAVVRAERNRLGIARCDQQRVVVRRVRKPSRCGPRSLLARTA